MCRPWGDFGSFEERDTMSDAKITSRLSSWSALDGVVFMPRVWHVDFQKDPAGCPSPAFSRIPP